MSGAPDPSVEIETLFPDVSVEVRDPDTGDRVSLVVREFRFREGLEAQAAARPLVEVLAEAAADEAGAVDALAVDAIMSEHADLWLQLLGQVSDRDPDWLARLSDADGQRVSIAMWEANRGFFMRRVALALAARRKSRSASPASSTSLSGPGTDPGTAKSQSA